MTPEKPFQGQIEILQLHDPDHSGLVYDLLQQHQDWLMDDFSLDPIQMIGEMAENQQKQIATGWIAQRDSQKKSEFLGLIWVEVDRLRIGRLFGAATLSVKNGISRDGIRFAKQFIQYCFESLKLRKLVAEVATTNRNAERFMQLLGFRKEGLLLNESLKNGQPVHWVRLQLLPNQEDRKHNKTNKGGSRNGKTQQ
jgi:hypothetical protein